MKKIFICVNDACQLRKLDAEKISNYMTKNGHVIVQNPKDADIIIFVACAVVSDSAKVNLDIIREFQKYDAELIVAGCLPAIEKEKLATIFDGEILITKNLDEIDHLFPEHDIKFKSIKDANVFFEDSYRGNLQLLIKYFLKKLYWTKFIYFQVEKHYLKKLIGENSFVYITRTKNLFDVRISWGCIGNCSYCAIKKAVGPYYSKPQNQCVEEFKEGFNRGYKEFLITADDSGAYGIDIKSSFPELLNEIIQIEGKYQITIQNLNPGWIAKYVEYLERIIRKQKITLIDSQIQSGNPRILKLMNRYSDTKKIKDAFIRLKKACPDLSLYTNVMVGFPTETDKEFEETLYFVKESMIDTGFIFPFSCRKGTESEKLEPKVSSEEINNRLTYAKKFLSNEGYVVTYKKNLFSFYKNKRKNR